jgi:hypothetical protein
MLAYTYNFVDANGHNNGNVASIANNLDTTRSQSFTYGRVARKCGLVLSFRLVATH